MLQLSGSVCTYSSVAKAPGTNRAKLDDANLLRQLFNFTHEEFEVEVIRTNPAL